MINNNQAIKQYKIAATDKPAKLAAIKTINPFWNKLEASAKHQILAFIGEFKQARSGVSCYSSDEATQNEILTRLHAYLQTKQLLLADLSMDELASCLYSLMKNDSSFMKTKVTDGLNSLLFHPQALEEDKPVYAGKQFLLKHAKSDSEFAKKLLDNLKRSNSKPILIFSLASNLRHFPIRTASAQHLIAAAIRDGKFGEDDLLLKSLAEGVVIFTDWKAQSLVAAAISDDKFGMDPLVLLELTKNIASFTSQQAQAYIARAILFGKFGADPLVLLELAKNIASFTSQQAKHSIAIAIMHGGFGADPLVLLELAKNIASFTSQQAQEYIADAIRYDNFGMDPLVLLELAKNIASFTSLKAQEDIARAILEDKFGMDQSVLTELAKTIISIGAPQSQIVLANSIKSGKLGPLTQGQLKFITSRWVMPTKQYQEISALIDPTKSLLHHEKLQFGQFQNYNYADDEYANVAGITIDSCFGCASDITGQPSLALFGYGTHGVICNKDGAAEFLITYREDVTAQNTEHVIKERFDGFFNPNSSYFALYQNNLSHLQVYDINPGKDGYPVLLDKIVAAEKFDSFPHWLQQAIRSQEFDPKQYQSPHILEFVLSFIDSLPFAQDDIGKKTRAIILTIIKGQGNPFNLASDHQIDAKLKNEINEAFKSEDNAVLYKGKLDTFWQTLSVTDDKLKLIFLLGQIAKRGALGYHFAAGDENNSANRAFYKLTEHGVAKLIQEKPPTLPAYIKTMATNLSLGLCIEVETNNLMLAHPQINTVWQKKL